jgi:hypothetical protein
MGNGPSTLVAYGYTEKTCIENLQALLEYEYGANLYAEEEEEEGKSSLHGKKKRYYILYKEERLFVHIFSNGTGDGPVKAVVLF